jgi:hypothetical protein
MELKREELSTVTLIVNALGVLAASRFNFGLSGLLELTL